MHRSSCGVQHGSNSSSRKRFAILSSEDQRYNLSLPSRDEVNELSILITTPMTDDYLEALWHFFFGQLYQSLILRTEFLGHLLGGQMLVRHAVIDSTVDVI